MSLSARRRGGLYFTQSRLFHIGGYNSNGSVNGEGSAYKLYPESTDTPDWAQIKVSADPPGAIYDVGVCSYNGMTTLHGGRSNSTTFIDDIYSGYSPTPSVLHGTTWTSLTTWTLQSLTKRLSPSTPYRGKLLIAGGALSSAGSAQNTSYYFDGTNLAVTPTDSTMTTVRKYHSLVTHRDKVYAIAGATDVAVLSSVERYDEVNGWVLVSPLPVARYFTHAMAFRGKIWVIGGETGTGAASNEIYTYNALRDTWTRETGNVRWFNGTTWAEFPALRQGACVANGKYMFIYGGYDSAGNVSNICAFTEDGYNWFSLPTSAIHGFNDPKIYRVVSVENKDNNSRAGRPAYIEGVRLGTTAGVEHSRNCVKNGAFTSNANYWSLDFSGTGAATLTWNEAGKITIAVSAASGEADVQLTSDLGAITGGRNYNVWMEYKFASGSNHLLTSGFYRNNDPTDWLVTQSIVVEPVDEMQIFHPSVFSVGDEGQLGVFFHFGQAGADFEIYRIVVEEV